MKKVLMQRVICFCLCLINLNAFSQTKKDSAVKTVPLPAQGSGQTADYKVPKERVMYLVLPESNWVKITQMLRKSKYPSDEIDEVIQYITVNAREVPSSPADSTHKK